MKSKYLLFLLCFLGSCKKKQPAFFSFQDKWGVVCFFEYAHQFGAQRTVFLPLENPSDSASITSKSSIFEFKYGLGMDYHDHGSNWTNYKTYWISDHNKVLSVKDYNEVKVYWAFAKLKYHAVGKVKEPLKGELFQFTLIDKNNELPVETFNFKNTIATDTAYFKKKFIMPVIDTTKLKLKVKPRSGNYL